MGFNCGANKFTTIIIAIICMATSSGIIISQLISNQFQFDSPYNYIIIAYAGLLFFISLLLLFGGINTKMIWFKLWLSINGLTLALLIIAGGTLFVILIIDGSVSTAIDFLLVLLPGVLLFFTMWCCVNDHRRKINDTRYESDDSISKY